ncbi:WecB/TagA/CpsF family glycosyltransferase [Roseibium sp.]|uniref:WecB/TagA/CpsF family glycosyltransferase n=1 Tax=Roseibium sp. TaxID=1936156 RepID=UPI003D10E5FD
MIVTEAGKWQHNGSAKAQTTTLLGGLPITNIGMEETAEQFVEIALQAGTGNQLPFYSTSANGQVIAMAAQDEEFRQLLLRADQIHADGMPMVLLSRYVSKTPLAERVATTDLVHAVARKAEETGVTFYFLGAREDVNALAVERMRQLYPKLQFVGRSHGYFSPERDEQAVVEEINRLRPGILWIGLGVPMEQKFVSRNLHKLQNVGVIKTSGGLFDFLSGKNSRAPGWMQSAGLEWLYRTMLEPRRLAHRYFLTNPIALREILTRSE